MSFIQLMTAYAPLRMPIQNKGAIYFVNLGKAFQNIVGANANARSNQQHHLTAACQAA
jgi:hypothetical protein